MAKNKNNQAIWNTRIKKSASSLFQKVGNSIDIDKRLYKEDIQGSIAHVEMLFKQKIISFKIKNQINQLDVSEKELKKKITKFRQDEIDHKDIAYDKGATKKGPYLLLDKIIKTGSKIAINISEKI